MIKESYHADTSRISRSGIIKVRQNPFEYWRHYLDPNREPEEPTPALIEGALVHAATFEPHKMSDLFAVRPPGLDLRSAKDRAKFNSFKEYHRDRQIVTIEQMHWSRAVASAVYGKAAARRLLSEGVSEEPIFFTHPDTGIACKIKPDHVYPRGPLLVDLKTTEDASENAFRWSILKYGYDIQAAFYLDGYNYKHGVYPEGFVFIAVEKKDPAPEKIALYYADDDMINLGREKYREGLHIYKECLRRGEWPGYPEEIQRISLPNYAFT